MKCYFNNEIDGFFATTPARRRFVNSAQIVLFDDATKISRNTFQNA